MDLLLVLIRVLPYGSWHMEVTIGSVELMASIVGVAILTVIAICVSDLWEA